MRMNRLDIRVNHRKALSHWIGLFIRTPATLVAGPSLAAAVAVAVAVVVLRPAQVGFDDVSNPQP
jgi:hypothetical protein